MSTRLIIVRSPENHARPELYISNYLKQAAGKEYDEVIDLGDLANTEFDFPENQSEFFNFDQTNQIEASLASALGDSLANDTDVFFVDAFTSMVVDTRKTCFLRGMNNVRLFGLFHSSVHTPGDFYNQAVQPEWDWVSLSEAACVAALDKVVVATKYLADRLADNPFIDSLKLKSKLVIRGLPVTSPKSEGIEVSGVQIETDDESILLPVYFSHRWAPDKNPNTFLRFARLLGNTNLNFIFEGREIKFIPTVLSPVPIPEKYTTGEVQFITCESREDYWEKLGRRGIIFSSAELETFGYSVSDAVISGCIPVLSDSACYSELYDKELLYTPNNYHSFLKTLVRASKMLVNGASPIDYLTDFGSYVYYTKPEDLCYHILKDCKGYKMSEDGTVYYD